MFNFLKKIFKKEEIQEEKVALENLDKWFDDKTNQMLNELDNKIKIIKNKVGEEISKTKQNLEILRDAELRNPKIPFRAKQLMEGNRDAYIKRVDVFLKQIELDKNYEELLNFCNNFDDKLTDFGKSTVKAYHVLQEFFANESNAIAGNIKNLDNFIKEIKNEIKGVDTDSIRGIKEEIIELNNRKKQKEKNKEELEKKQKEKNNLVKIEEDITKEIEILKKDKEYEKLNKLKVERDEIIKKIGEHKNKLIHSFSVIEAALKKFLRIAFENEKLINKYLKNPLFLKEDNELKIIDILKDLEENVLNNSIQLKDRKKEKTLEEIKKMDKEFFNNFLEKYKELKEKLNNVDNEINKIDILERINKYYDRKKENELKLEKIEKDIINLKDKIGRDDIDKIKEKVKKEIKERLEIKITIS